MFVLLYIDASFRVSGDGSDMQNDFKNLQESMENRWGLHVTETAEGT